MPTQAYTHASALLRKSVIQRRTPTLTTLPPPNLAEEEVGCCGTAQDLTPVLMHHVLLQLSHRVVDALRGAAEHAWLVELLDAFNAGNVGKFSDLRPTWSAKCPALAGHADALLLKVRLLAVMEQVFQRQAKDRTIAFGDLATAANVAEDEVEVLVMKALSLGLVKGTLDQIDQVVAFTWVQPRVLDKTQLQDMHVRLGDWLTKVESATQLMSQTAPELLVGH
eukprot:m.880471 g.880471  ORF g.880471 m.880471 type:complete len:223 (-) comp23591_c2_seq1:2713-3381(-)